MRQKSSEFPRTAADLINRVDQEKAKKASLEVVDDIRRLISEMCKDARLKDNGGRYPYREARYKFIDGKDVLVRDRPKGTSVIHTIERITDINGVIHGISRRYFIDNSSRRPELEIEIQPVLDIESREQDFKDFYDAWEDSSMPQEKYDAIEKYRGEGNDLAIEMGLDQATNDEALNLLRLLKTAEPVAKHYNRSEQ